MLKEHDRIVLVKDLPKENLKAGDMGTIVHVYRNGEAFEVEFLTPDGDTTAIATVRPSQVHPAVNREIPFGDP